MGVTLTKTEVLDKFRAVHGDTYSYDNFLEYCGMFKKITITCPIHGDFEQTPSDHRNGQNCPKCAQLTRNAKQTSNRESFIKKAIKKHGELYDYSKVNYSRSADNVEIVCNTHGSFWKTPNKHLMGQGCPKCNNAHRRTQQDFVEDSISTHGTLYDYSKSLYKNVDTPVVIICPIHGEFSQTPYTHIKKGCGCPSCSNHGFKYHSKAILYYLKIVYHKKTFYKIGITNRSIEERFSIQDLRKIEVLFTREFLTGYEAFEIEQHILKANRRYKYTGEPILTTNGNTELFTRDISSNVEQYFIGPSIDS